MSAFPSPSFHELIQEARDAEANADPKRARQLYEKAIKKEPHNEVPYSRLMILFRKEKNYEAELSLINRAIKTFEEFYQKRSEKLIGGRTQATRLSNALARSLGQRGKKTEELYYPEPIPKWLKRQEVVERKLGK